MSAPVLPPPDLKAWLRKRRIRHADLADALGISRSAATQLINRGIWPARDALAVAERLEAYLINRGYSAANKKPRGERPQGLSHEQQEGDEPMLLQKQALAPATRQHFNLSRDPFTPCVEPADVFLSPDARYAREAMWSTVRHGGFLAVVGESGAGKSTLREELAERIEREEAPVVMCEPYVLAMEDKDTVGKTLRSHHIAEAIMATIAPTAKPRSSPEARFRQLHEVLRESARSGLRHTLLIEEAHCLPIPTLKHLKRYLELKDGMRPLLSIILLAQPELMLKLDVRNPHVREVAQRIEIATLAPLDQHLGDYLQHRWQRIGARLDDTIDASGIEAIRSRLSPNGKQQGSGSLLYPLAVHNVMSRAMNMAAQLGVPKVTGDTVREV
mgnify:CR=1 FL=1